MPTGATPNPKRPVTWTGPDWPAAGSMGKPYGLASSPFGKSVDMVDICTQLMESGGERRFVHFVLCPGVGIGHVSIFAECPL